MSSKRLVALDLAYPPSGPFSERKLSTAQYLDLAIGWDKVMEGKLGALQKDIFELNKGMTAQNQSLDIAMDHMGRLSRMESERLEESIGTRAKDAQIREFYAEFKVLWNRIDNMHNATVARLEAEVEAGKAALQACQPTGQSMSLLVDRIETLLAPLRLGLPVVQSIHDSLQRIERDLAPPLAETGQSILLAVGKVEGALAPLPAGQATMKSILESIERIERDLAPRLAEKWTKVKVFILSCSAGFVSSLTSILFAEFLLTSFRKWKS